MCDMACPMVVGLILWLALVQDIERVIDRDPVIRVLPRDAIPALNLPGFVEAGAAAAFMHDDEIIIGVADGKQAKAYSTWLLDRHEIVNDTMGPIPIAVTW